MAHQMKTHTEQLIAKLPGLVNKLERERAFFLTGLDRFTLTTIPDGADTSDKDEPEYGAILPESYCNECANTPSMVLAHYMHMMGHKLCDLYWRRCAVQRSVFSKGECDFIEELYIQRMFLSLGGTLHADFLECVVKFEKYRNWVNPQYRSVINTLFSTNPSPDLDEHLKNMYNVLYANDPFNYNTFGLYALLCCVNLEHHGLRDVIAKYDEIMPDYAIW